MNDALSEIKRLARLGRVRFSRHARDRMAERGASEPDVRHALVTATSTLCQSDRASWRLEGGFDLDGDDLVVVLAVEANVLIITVFA